VKTGRRPGSTVRTARQRGRWRADRKDGPARRPSGADREARRARNRWVKDNIAPDGKQLGTFGARLRDDSRRGPHVWWGLEPIIDYQMLIRRLRSGTSTSVRARSCQRGHCDVGRAPCTAIRAPSYAWTDPSAENARSVPGATIMARFPTGSEYDDALNTSATRRHAARRGDPRFRARREQLATPVASWVVQRRIDFVANDGAQQRRVGSGMGLGHMMYVYERSSPRRAG